MFNPKDEAMSIFSEFTVSMIHIGQWASKTDFKARDVMAEECADILIHRWLNHKYSFMEYSEICNELSKILWQEYYDLPNIADTK